MKRVIYIKADTNDADYITEETVISGSPHLENKFRDILKKILNFPKAKKWSGISFETSEYSDDEMFYTNLYRNVLTEDELEFFRNFVPYGECGVHTIVDIQIRNIEEEKLF